MGNINNPFPTPNIAHRLPHDLAYRKFQGRIDQGNVYVRGLSPGTVVSNNSPAGNLDAIHLTASFPSATAATQSFSTSHTLGRHPVGVEVVNANQAINIFSDTQTSNLTRETNVFLGALVLGGPVTATVRIW